MAGAAERARRDRVPDGIGPEGRAVERGHQERADQPAMPLRRLRCRLSGQLADRPTLGPFYSIRFAISYGSGTALASGEQRGGIALDFSRARVPPT